MIIAIMQPYFFPYIGYFQLMSAVDLFVFYDDVQYLDRAWMNRNRIRVDNHKAWLTFPVRQGSRSLAVNQRQYILGNETDKVLRRVRAAYAKAPFFDEASALVDACLDCSTSTVARFNAHLLTLLAGELGLSCRFESASSIGCPADLKGQDRILALCEKVQATDYVNPIGGQALYKKASFAERDVGLSFLRTTTPPAQLEGGPAHLSILDHLMMEGLERTRTRMGEWERVEAAA